MRKYIVISIIVVGILLGFITGLYIYKTNSIDKKNGEYIAELIEDECTALGELDESELLGLVETNNNKEKTSPNCIINLKVYYNVCDHLIETKKNIQNADVNLTEEEIKERFKEWELQKFTPSEIVLYKEVNEFCNEHYLLKERDGYVAIYKLDQNDKSEFYQTTEISTEYLADEDMEEIEKGIKIYTQKELNKTLEDFE